MLSRLPGRPEAPSASLYGERGKYMSDATEIVKVGILFPIYTEAFHCSAGKPMSGPEKGFVPPMNRNFVKARRIIDSGVVAHELRSSPSIR